MRRGHRRSSTRAICIGDHQIPTSTGISYVTLAVFSPTRSDHPPGLAILPTTARGAAPFFSAGRWTQGEVRHILRDRICIEVTGIRARARSASATIKLQPAPSTSSVTPAVISPTGSRCPTHSTRSGDTMSGRPRHDQPYRWGHRSLDGLRDTTIRRVYRC